MLLFSYARVYDSLDEGNSFGKVATPGSATITVYMQTHIHTPIASSPDERNILITGYSLSKSRLSKEGLVMNTDDHEATPLLIGSHTSKIQQDDKSVEVKLRDFQLIRVPKEAVSYILHMINSYYHPLCSMVCDSFIKYV